MSKLIVFEGLDGTGKSSLIFSLAQYLIQKGASVHLAAYPRKHEDGAIARQLYNTPGSDPKKMFHHLFLNMLKGNAWINTSSADFVLLDRYYYSIIGYQHGYYGLPLTEIYKRSESFKLLKQPDICIYTHCDYQLSKWRIINRDGLHSPDLKFYATYEIWEQMRSAYNLAFSMKMLQPKKLLSLDTDPHTQDMITLLPSNFLDRLYVT